MRLNINKIAKIIDRIEEICRILNKQVASEDKDKLHAELEMLLLDVVHYRKSAEINISKKL